MRREYRACAGCRKRIALPRWTSVDPGQTWYCIACGGWPSVEWVREEAKRTRLGEKGGA